MPEEYEIDYLIYSISDTLEDEMRNWDMPYIDVVKRAMFKKFDNYVEDRIIEGMK